MSGGVPEAGVAGGAARVPDMTSVPTVTLEDVLAAREELAGLIRPTPLEFSRVLSDKLGTDVYLK